MDLTKVLSTNIDSLMRRVVKVLRFGKSDVQTALDVSSYGIDSHPIKDMIAVYSDTSEKGKTVIIGYINKNKLAEIGELRLFSTNSTGTEQFYTWLKNDGTMEIGGDGDNMVRYSELEIAFNQLKSDFNSLVTAYNTHVHPIVNAVPLATPPGIVTSSVTVTTGVPSAANIAPAKIDEIKTL